MDLRLELEKSGCFNTYSILLKEKSIGQISLTEYRDSIHIDSILIEQNYRKNGFGRQVVKHLKSKHKVITGESSPFAINFWKKVGAKFHYEVNDEMIDFLMDIGEYPGFIIC